MIRRGIDMITSALLLIGLGLIVAVSARSLPGQGNDETIDEMTLSWPDWLWPVMQWVALTIAAVIAAYLVVSIRRGHSWDWSDLKGVLGRLLVVLLWAAAFIFIYTVTGPPEEGAPSGDPPPPLGGETGDLFDVGPTLSSTWVAAILVILVALAVIARFGLAYRGPVLSPAEDEDQQPRHPEDLAEPLELVPGGDPRSRVIDAYARFEQEAQRAGFGRRLSETARKHADRAGSGLGAARSDVELLGHNYELARFTDLPVVAAEAEAAETAWQRMLDRMRG